VGDTRWTNGSETGEEAALDRSASEIAAALARGEISARALCEAAIARIEARDATLNAVVVRDFARARSDAARADEALARGERMPLLGVPMTVKESFDMVGLPTTWGIVAARGAIARADATCVTRLRRAGAVILGKTNVAERLGDWQSVNDIYGRTAHPLDPTRTPGGSSGGSAAAVASHMVPLELGSDIGGSIRVPAAFCGVFGHKPSYGLVPSRGHDEPGFDGATPELGVVGPIARTADDLRLALDVLAGPDGDDAKAFALTLPPPRIEQLAGARILVLTAHPSAATAPELRATLATLAGRLEAEGARVVDQSDHLPDLAAAHRTYLKLVVPITTRAAPREDRASTAYDWLALLDERARLRRQWRALFEAFDAVIAPAFGTYAFRHVEEPNWEARTLRIGDADTPYGQQLAWPGIATLPGLPATAVPVGKTAEGLPLGVQVIGPMFEDATTIAVSKWVGALQT
jgi:amidase